MRRLTALLLALITMSGLFIPALAEQTEPLIDALDLADLPRTPDGVHHYLLVCMDSWAAKMNNLGNNDGMVLLTIDEVSQRVMLTSFIRDMLVQLPDGKPGRIRSVVRYYGIQGLIDTLNRHFGLHIEKYILMDWNQVQKIVDAAGGVDLIVNSAEAQYLRNYAIPTSSTVPKMQSAGEYHFSGHASVIYMRMRKVRAMNGDAQDFGRTYRTRTVLTNIASQLSGISYDGAQELLNAVMDNMLDTNLTVADLFEALDLAFQMRGLPLESFRLPIDDSYRFFDLAGGAAQLMDFAKNREALSEFMFKQGYLVSD